MTPESTKSAIGHNVSQTIALNVGGSNEVKMGLNSFGTEIPKPDQCFWSGGGGGGGVKEMKLGLTRLAMESWKSIGDQIVCSIPVF